MDSVGGRRFKRLTWGFLLATSSWSMINTMRMSYWQYFMTDVCHIATSVAGTALLVGGVIDAVSSLVAGIVVEKCNFQTGKYRTWLALCPAVVAAGFLLMFTDYGLSESLMAGIMTFGYVTAYFAANIAVTVKNLVPSVEARDARQRAILSAKKGQGSAIGPFVFGLVALNLIMFFNGGSQGGAFGYLAATAVFGAVTIACHLVLYFTMSDGRAGGRVAAGAAGRGAAAGDTQEGTAGKGAAGARRGGSAAGGRAFVSFEKLSARRLLASLAATPPYICVLVADSFRYVGRAVLVGMVAYYFSYVLDDPAGLAFFFSASGLLAVVGSVASEALVRHMQKRTLYMAGYLIMIGCFVGMYLFGTQTAVFNAFACLWFLGLSFVNGTHLGLYADGIDYGIAKSKVDHRSWLISLSTLCPKAGTVMSALVTGYGLVFIGYVAGSAPDAAVVDGLRMLTCLVPAVLMGVGFVVFLMGYRLGRKEMAQVERELGRRD